MVQCQRHERDSRMVWPFVAAGLRLRRARIVFVVEVKPQEVFSSTLLPRNHLADEVACVQIQSGASGHTSDPLLTCEHRAVVVDLLHFNVTELVMTIQHSCTDF